MAKVIGPLFSFGASGKLAKTLIYSVWKGIKTVKQYVVPSNPKTDAQQTQRGFWKTVVDLWHSTNWNAADLTAWNLLASISGKIQSGFNQFVSLCVDVLVAGLTLKTVSNFTETTPGSTTYVLTFDSSLTNAKECTLKYGANKSVLTEEKDGTADGTNVAFSLTGLTASTKYYCKVIPKDATERAYSGLYTFTTEAAA